jgi:hypothetical protein
MGNDRERRRFRPSGSLAERIGRHLDAANQLLRQSDRVVQRAATRVRQTRQRIAGTSPPADPPGPAERFLAVKQRELTAHRGAIELHEQAAVLQERLGHPDRAATAREHANHARELYRRAWEELAEYERRRTTDRPVPGRQEERP